MQPAASRSRSPRRRRRCGCRHRARADRRLLRSRIDAGHRRSVDSRRSLLVGTSDLHGGVLPEGGRAAGSRSSTGMSATSARRDRADGGGVLLVDAGDLFQGTLESNLNEGAGRRLGLQRHRLRGRRHRQPRVRLRPDRSRRRRRRRRRTTRAARLKARAAEARFPFLAANIIDHATRTAG